MIPYGRQSIDEDDIRAVVDVLRSDFLTTGPAVETFEKAVAAFTGGEEAVAVCNGTAALHCAMDALGIGPGDEVIVPSITFVATANCVMYQGARPVFADVDPLTLTLDPEDATQKLSPRTKAILAVDFAGQTCDYGRLSALAAEHGLPLVADACHSLGASQEGRPVGSLAAMSAFSFHPVKHITTGEGGMVVTSDCAYARRMRTFRNHGIVTDYRQREETGTWRYAMESLGHNYRLTDIQCALGLSQLAKLPGWLRRRREIAALYDEAFAGWDAMRPLAVRAGGEHAYHLYVVRLAPGIDRDRVHRGLRRRDVGANVHYAPVHLQPYYRRAFGLGPGLCPEAERAGQDILSLPIYPTMSPEDVNAVIRAVRDTLDEELA